MSKRGVLQIENQNRLKFWCPGCQEHHVVTIGEGRWSFNENYENPTFRPSVLVTSGHYASSYVPGEECWCTFNIQHGDDRPGYKCQRCHAFITDGSIEYLSDSSHHLSGKTVKLMAWP